MEDVDDPVAVLVKDCNVGSRKRKSQESKRSAKKKELYGKPKNANTFVPCRHHTTKFQCGQFTPRDGFDIRNRIYNVPDLLSIAIFLKFGSLWEQAILSESSRWEFVNLERNLFFFFNHL